MKMVTKKTNDCGKVLDLVRRTYPALSARIKNKWPKQGEITCTDILHDTIIRVMHDEKAQAIDNEAEFIEYFVYRANVTIYQITHNEKSRLKCYADYKKIERFSATSEEE